MIMLYRLGEFPSGLKWTAIINFCIIGGTLREVLGKTLFRFYTHHSLATLNFLVVLALLFYLQVKAPRQAS
jgi:CDP-diglyceride synthetase